MEQEKAPCCAQESIHEDLIASVERELPEDEVLYDLAELFKMFADSTRVKILYALFERALLYDISFMVMWFWLMMGYASCYIAKFEPMLETQYLFHKKRITRTML